MLDKVIVVESNGSEDSLQPGEYAVLDETQESVMLLAVPARSWVGVEVSREELTLAELAGSVILRRASGAIGEGVGTA
jgi:hypothetical protein